MSVIITLAADVPLGHHPSKALRHAVSRIIEFNQNPLYSDHSRLLRSSFADILNHADNVINQQTRMRQGFYERNHCEILQGNAHFIDEHTLALECHDGTVETLTAEKFVIACGSRPYHPMMWISRIRAFMTATQS